MSPEQTFGRPMAGKSVAVAYTGMYLAAGIAEYFDAQPNVKVSAIQVASGGSIYVTPF